MKHIESSVFVPAKKPLDAATVKYSLVQRLRNAFHVETVGEGTENFSVSATAKSNGYVFNLNVAVKTDDAGARVLVDGGNEVSMGTKIFYVLSLLAVLAYTFFPAMTQSEGDSNAILEAIFFLVVGGFIIYDMNKKFDEPQGLIDKILESVKVEFS